MKKFIAFLISLSLLTSLSACTTSLGTDSLKKESSANDNISIGILQLAEHPALDASREGFIKALADNGFVDKENITIDFQNAQGDPSSLLTMSQRFVNNKSTLVLAIATGSAQAMASQTKDIPILATAVTDFASAGLVDSDKMPNTNVSGTNDMSPIEKQIELMLQLAPDTKTVGVLYSSSEDNSVLQAEIVNDILKKKNLSIVTQTVASSNDVQQATQSLVTKCDAIYVPTDNVIASSMAIVADITQAAKIPVICGEEGPVQNGGLATLGLNYFELGYQTGEMAVKILSGADIKTMPVESQTEFNYLVNKETATILGIEIPDNLKEFVK